MTACGLTTTQIQRYKPTTVEARLYDGNGLYLRVRRGQAGSLSRIWLYAHKAGAQSVYVTIGEFEASLPEAALYRLPAGTRVTLETARKIAAELRDWRKRGRDPKSFREHELGQAAVQPQAAAAADVLLERQQAIERLTVRDLFEVWLADGVRRGDGNAELQRAFQADVLPAIGHVPIKALTEHDVRRVLRVMVARGVNRAAVMMRNNLTQMFSWAEKRQPWRKLLAEGNPMDLIEIRKIISPDYDVTYFRDRVLSADEIRELRDVLHQAQAEYVAATDKRCARQPLEPTTQYAIWIMLATMCPVGELTMARWEHVDLQAAQWFIPKENVKGNLGSLTAYLSEFACDQFRQLHERTGHSEWCFPARNQAGHVDVKSISKQIGDRQTRFKKSADGQPRRPMQHRRHDDTLVLGGGKRGAWTAHDLRRTGATLMQSLGISLDIIDRCQNHVLPGSRIRRHYLHHDYADEKRHAWQALGERLVRILSTLEREQTIGKEKCQAADDSAAGQVARTSTPGRRGRPKSARIPVPGADARRPARRRPSRSLP